MFVLTLHEHARSVSMEKTYSVGERKNKLIGSFIFMKGQNLSVIMLAN